MVMYAAFMSIMRRMFTQFVNVWFVGTLLPRESSIDLFIKAHWGQLAPEFY